METERLERYEKLDEIRGITLVSMILYHACWDAVYLVGCDWAWYGTTLSDIWQQSIAWTFILLSGFCWQLGKRRLRRGLTVFGCGLLVTAVTAAVVPQSRIVFGVLTLIGSCMLLMIPLHHVFFDRGSDTAQDRGKVAAEAGLGVSLGLFFLTRNVNGGCLGFEAVHIARLPESWYANGLTTYLGFPAPGFFSTDYFSLIPWVFLFLSGYFLFHMAQQAGRLKIFAGKTGSGKRGVFHMLRWMGRHSLLIYMLHQPVLYALCSLS